MVKFFDLMTSFPWIIFTRERGKKRVRKREVREGERETERERKRERKKEKCERQRERDGWIESGVKKNKTINITKFATIKKIYLLLLYNPIFILNFLTYHIMTSKTKKLHKW